MGIGYLISSLRKEFGRNAIKFKLVNHNIEQEVRKFRPDLVGISSVSQNYNKAIAYARTVKAFDISTIIGGVHISTLPTSMTNDMDVAVMGEGEETIVDLFKLFHRDGKFSNKELKKINGIAFKEGDNVVMTRPRPLIEPLDKIPFPARDLLDVGITTHMLTARGCPYKCVFCSTSRFWNKVRFFSAEYVVREIELLVNKYHVKRILFYDDLFTMNKDRMRKIIELLRGDGLLGKIGFACNARANLVDDEMASLMKQLNIKSAFMGLESGSPRMLNYLKAGTVTVEQNKNAVRILKKHDINTAGAFIIGSPNETEVDIFMTLKFIKDNPLDTFIIFLLTPYPATPVWEYAKKKGIVSNENMDWDKLSWDFKNNYDKLIIFPDKISKERLFELYMISLKLVRLKRIKYFLKVALTEPKRTVPQVSYYLHNRKALMKELETWTRGLKPK